MDEIEQLKIEITNLLLRIKELKCKCKITDVRYRKGEYAGHSFTFCKRCNLLSHIEDISRDAQYLDKNLNHQQ